MPTDDSTPQSTARNTTANTVATIVLLVVHGCLYGVSLLLLGLMVMVTDACAYQKCGDPAWIDRALTMATWGGGALLLADIVAAVYLLNKQRRAFVVPIVGCLAQGALAAGAWAMELQAGPL